MMPVTTVPVSQIAAAFGRMSEAGHIGKVVVSFDDKNALVQEQAGASLPIASDATYLVTGGTGGFGLETARWLVDNGARSLVLAARSRMLTAEVEATLSSLRSSGAAVTVVSADVGTRAGVRATLAAVERAGNPLRGIVHAAGTIDDALIEKLAPDRIRRVFTGKVLGAWHLHELTRLVPLDFFVVYSSVAATLGSPGQAHYAAANRMLDAIAALRRSQGLPATSIAFGPIGDRGYLARRRGALRQRCRDAGPAGCRRARGPWRRPTPRPDGHGVRGDQLVEARADVRAHRLLAANRGPRLGRAERCGWFQPTCEIGHRRRVGPATAGHRRGLFAAQGCGGAQGRAGGDRARAAAAGVGARFAHRVRAEESYRDRAGGRASRRKIPAAADHGHGRPRDRRGDQYR